MVRQLDPGPAPNGNGLDLAPDSLNDAANAFMPGNEPAATTFYDTPGLSVRVASPRYLFVMKAMAARELVESIAAEHGADGNAIGSST